MLPEHKNWLNDRRTKIIAGVAILATFFVGGYLASESNKAKPNQTVATDTTKTGETQKQSSVPNEAKSFVAEYGSRYSDTTTAVSTYYAVEAYKSNHNGVDPVMSNEYVNSYDFKADKHFPTSPLGFELKQLPTDALINQETSMKLFDEYTAPMLEKYMELISKNPSPNAVKIIDEQALDYLAGKYLLGYDTWDENQRDSAKKMLNTIKGVVAKHGSIANYSVALASNDNKNTNATFFDKDFGTITGGYSMHNNEKLAIFSDTADIVVNVDTYNKDGEVSHTKEVLKRIQLSVERQPAPRTENGSAATWTYISIGQV